MNLICFSHLRWKDSYPLPQYVLNRFSKQYVTYFIEDCVITDQQDGYELKHSKEDVLVISPHLKGGNFSENEKIERTSTIIKDFFGEEGMTAYMLWFSNPMAYAYTKGLKPKLNIYACMEEFKITDGSREQFDYYKKMLNESADIVLEEHINAHFSDIQLHESIYVEMNSCIKNQLQSKEPRKIIKLPSLSDYNNSSVTEYFGS